MIDALVNVSRAIPEALTNRFISPADKTATPTATSGIVLQPAALARLQDKASAPTPTPPKRPAEDDATLLSDATRAALTPPASGEASATIVDRRANALPWLLALAAIAIALLALFLLSRY